MRTYGLLGGTFDPIHNGHLAIAVEAHWALGLDRVWFVPAAHQPLKPDGHCATAADRLAMCQAAVAGNPAFDVCDLEIRRSGPSYTIDTVAALQSSFPLVEFVFIIGADVVPHLTRWHRINELVNLCRFAVVGRPGYRVNLDQSGLGAVAANWTVIEGPALEIAASALRERIRRGAPVRYQVPDAVDTYIREHNLYRECQ